MDTQTNIQFEPKEPNRNEIQVFTNPQFGEIRTAGTPDEPLFCLADLCRALELTNPSTVKNRLDRGDVQLIDLHALNSTDPIGNSMANFVTESGFFDVILQSSSPKVKPFRRWVTAEVLPSIRKHGAYLPNLPDFNDPAAAARAWADEVDAKRAALQQLKDAQERNKLLEPKAAWTDHQIGNDEMLYGWEQAAKHLKLRSAKKLTTFCLDHEFVFRRYDSKNKRWDYFPHAKFTEQGYFRVIQETPKHRDGTPVINQHTGQPFNPKRELKITEYGLVFLQSQLEKAGLVKPVFGKEHE